METRRLPTGQRIRSWCMVCDAPCDGLGPMKPDDVKSHTYCKPHYREVMAKIEAVVASTMRGDAEC